MSLRLRQFVSRFLLLALVFNALSPLIAAAREHAGEPFTLELCTASGLKQVAVETGGKALPKPALRNPCPFCLLAATGAALPPAPPALSYRPLHPETQPDYLAPAQPRSAHKIAAPPRGPPALA
jgi:hypothetical protein